MAKKIFLSPSNQDGNKYAYGNTTEDVQCGRIAVALKAALERCGFEVKLEQYDTIQNRVAHANAWGADMYIVLHTNATLYHNAGGTQVFYFAVNGYGNVAATAIFNALKDITPGKNAERCSQYSTLYELKATNATAVYIEAEFHDIAEYAKWIIEHTDEIAEAICKGVCDYYNEKYIEKVVNSDETAVEEKTDETPTTANLIKGAALKLTKEPLYISSTAKNQASTVTGTYYIWGTDVINGRIRITNRPERAGVTGQVTGWIKAPSRTYTVKSGDTLSKIGKLFGKTAAEILAMNKAKYPSMTLNYIVVGWELEIPN